MERHDQTWYASESALRTLRSIARAQHLATRYAFLQRSGLLEPLREKATAAVSFLARHNAPQREQMEYRLYALFAD
jgi:hypothetical protein